MQLIQVCTVFYSHKGAEVKKYTVDKTQAICHALQDATRQMWKRPLNQ
jgi:hypothetical protein